MNPWEELQSLGWEYETSGYNSGMPIYYVGKREQGALTVYGTGWTLMDALRQAKERPHAA